MFLPKIMTEEKWLAVSAAGKLRFLIVNGLLGWGVTMAALWSGTMSIFVTDFDAARYVPLAFMVLPLVGLIWGLVTWKLNENKYIK